MHASTTMVTSKAATMMSGSKSFMTGGVPGNLAVRE